jgi:hypothetical protein
MTSTVAAFASGSAPVAGGPHEFGSLRLHHTTLARTQALDATIVEKSAGCLRPRTRAMPIARARSRGAAAGNVYRHCPKLVATPFPPWNPFHAG